MEGKDPVTGQFISGNQFWLARSRHGMKPKFSSPEMLWESCVDYFQWCEDHPLYEDKVGFYEGVAVHTPAAKMRAMTIEGLCIFIDITSRQWRDWRDEQPGLVPVMVVAEDIIRTQKFAGAAAGLLNANIIARDLGLKESSEVDNKSSDGSMSPVTAEALAAVMTLDQLRALEEEIRNRKEARDAANNGS